MLLTVRPGPLPRAKSQEPTAKSKGPDPPEAKVQKNVSRETFAFKNAN